MSAKVETTVDDLYKIEGKAEIVNGEIVYMPPAGYLPNRAAGNIYISLRQHEPNIANGHAVADNMAFAVDLPDRDSFSPDAAFFYGHADMRFAQGAPAFAVEVRSEHDYGAKAERKMAKKRADYFAAGASVVWDVDLLSDTPVKSYRTDSPDNPQTFRRGETANAEPAVPGWMFRVDDLFV